MQNQRFQYIDRLKGLAMFTVVMGHILVFGMNQRADTNYVEAFIISFNMPLFMFISGFVLKNVPSPSKLGVRVWRLLQPMFVVGMLYVLFLGVNADMFFRESYNLGYWYLKTLATFIILLAPFAFVKNTRHSALLDIGLALLIWVLLSIAKEKFFTTFHEDPVGIAHFYLWTYFIGGFLFRKYNVVASLSRQKALPWVFGTLYVVFFVLSFKPLSRDICTSWLYTYPNAVCFLAHTNAVLFLVVVFQKREHSKSWAADMLAFCGRKSLDIYLFHYFFIHLISMWGGLKHITSYALQIPLDLVFAVAVSLCAVAVGKIMHSNRITSFLLFGTFPKRSPAPASPIKK